MSNHVLDLMRHSVKLRAQGNCRSGTTGARVCQVLREHLQRYYETEALGADRSKNMVMKDCFDC